MGGMSVDKETDAILFEFPAISKLKLKLLSFDSCTLYHSLQQQILQNYINCKFSNSGMSNKALNK